MRRYRIDFDHLPPRLNMNTNHHWGRRASHAKKSHAAVKAAVEAQGIQIPLEPLQAVHVCYYFYLPTLHGVDLSELVNNAKNYIDMLCKPVFKKDGSIKRPGLSIIVDDRMTCVRNFCVFWELRRNEPGFFIQIQELPDA